MFFCAFYFCIAVYINVCITVCLAAILRNNKYINKQVIRSWNVHLPNALHSVCLNRLSCTKVGIYNGANSPNGFLTTAVA